MMQEEAISILKTYLEDKYWSEEIVDLTLLGYFVHEMAFNSTDGRTELARDALVEALTERIEPPGYLVSEQKEAHAEQQRASKLGMVVKFLACESSGLCHEELCAMIALGEKLSKSDTERTKKWIAKAWESGRHQRKVYSAEVEGSVNNEIGIIANFAAYLSLFGVKEGFRLSAVA